MHAVMKTQDASGLTVRHAQGLATRRFQLMQRSLRIAAPNSRALLSNRKIQFRAEGIYFLTDQPQVLGTEMDIEFLLQLRDLRFKLRGVVARCVSCDTGTDEKGFLLKVTEASDAVRRWLVGMETAQRSRREYPVASVHTHRPAIRASTFAHAH